MSQASLNDNELPFRPRLVTGLQRIKKGSRSTV